MTLNLTDLNLPSITVLPTVLGSPVSHVDQTGLFAHKQHYASLVGNLGCEVKCLSQHQGCLVKIYYTHVKPEREFCNAYYLRS